MELWISDWRRLGMDTRWRDCLPCLEPGQRDKALRFRREEDRIRSVTGALLVREALRRRFGPAGAALAYNACGKPCVPGSGYHFNLSHSGALVVLATAETEVGVDVEEMRPLDWREFTPVLTAEEQRLLRSSGDPADTFYRIWTIREAFAKRTGIGLSLFESGEPYEIRYDAAGAEVRWRGETLRVTGFVHEGHRIAAAGGPGEAPQSHILSESEWRALCIREITG